MPVEPSISWGEALDRIAARAQHVDISGAWPRENIDDLRCAGALGWRDVSHASERPEHDVVRFPADLTTGQLMAEVVERDTL